jgi:hypothetical protein
VEWEETSGRIRDAATARKRSLVGQEHIVDALEQLLFRHDPIGINFEDNTDEYRAEAETITLRLPDSSGVDDVQRIVHEEFVHWFDDKLAGLLSATQQSRARSGPCGRSAVARPERRVSHHRPTT